MIYNDETKQFEPGVIYELRSIPTGTPFYVGETTDTGRRLKEHKRNARKGGNQRAEQVYQYIYQNAIEFEMIVLEEYSWGGPGDLEDEWIVRRLMEGFPMQNMKKGSESWLAERIAAAKEMKVRGITSYREYKKYLEDNADKLGDHPVIVKARELGLENSRRNREREQKILFRAEQKRRRELADAAAREERIKQETIRLMELDKETEGKVIDRE